MATLVLVAGAQLAGAAWYGVLAAAALGSYLDSEYFFPDPDVEAPKVGDLRATAGSEGMSLNYALGPSCRVPGKVVGMPGPSRLWGDGSLRRDISIDVCQGEVEEAAFVEQIFANGRKIYDISPDISFLSEKISAVLVHYDLYVGLTATIELTSTNLEIDLTRLKLGYATRVSGFSTPGFNKTDWTPVSTSTVVGHATWTRVRLDGFSNPPGFSGGFGGGEGSSEAAGNAITVFQDLPIVTAGSFAGLNQYSGAADQAPGAGPGQYYPTADNPSRRGRAWVFLGAFNVTKFGGVVPNIEIVFRERITLPAADAITALVERAGIDTALLDVSGVTGTVRGLVAEEPIDSRVLIQMIMQVYQIRYREVGGQMVFYMASSPDVVDVDAADLAAYAGGEDSPPRLVEFTDPPDSEIPSRVEVEFSNYDNGLQQGNARETLHALQGNDQKVFRLRTPLTLSESEAAAFARREMMSRHASRQTRSTTFAPQYLHVSEGDVWTTEIDGQSLVSMVNSAEYGANRLIRIAGTQLQAQVSGIDAADIASEPGGGGGIETPLFLDIALIDSAPLTDADASRTGMYFISPDYASGGDFLGGSVLEKLPGALEFTAGQDVPGVFPYGVVSGVASLARDDANPAYWDRASELIVYPSGTFQPTSSTEDAVVGGANRAFYGNELIAWVDSEDLGDGTYKLTNLLRGLRGTEWAISADGTTYKKFVPVGGLEFYDMPQSAQSQVVAFKAVGIGWDEADVPETTLTARFRSSLPFPVYSVRGSRAADGELTVTWERQTRVVHPIFSSGPSPLLEASEDYEVDVTDGGGVSDGSPYLSGSAKTWVYSAAEQTEDGFTPGDPVELSIYQVGSLGRGHSKTITL